MPQILPLIPSEPHYEFETELDRRGYVFEVLWNERDQVWYLNSVAELDGTLIMCGVAIVLGAYLGRQFRHRLVSSGALIVSDAATSGIDAGLHELGKRVLVAHWTNFEVAAAIRAFAESLVAE